MLKSLSLVIIFSVSAPLLAGEATVAGVANTDPDLAGYKIYVGVMSRFATAVDYVEKKVQ